MSKDGVKLTIVPANDRTSYFFGEQVAGKVVVENTGGAKCRSVVVRLRAQIVVRLDNTAPTLGYSPWNKVFPLVAERGPQLELWSEHRSAQRQVFPAGVTEYPFVFETRAYTQMPPAYESMKGAVRWYIETVFVRPFKSDFCERLALQLRPAVPVDAPAYVRPVTKTKTEELRAFLSNKGRLALQITLDRGGYLPGQPILVAASVVNQSREPVTAVVLDVVQCTVCFDGGSKRVATNFSLFSTDCLAGGVVVAPNQQLPIQQTVYAPAAAPSFLHAHVAVNYSISLRVRTTSAVAEVSCPFVLGSWPPVQPMGPSMSPPAAPVGPAVPPPPPPAAPAGPGVPPQNPVGPYYYGGAPAGPAAGPAAGQPQQGYYPTYPPQQPPQQGGNPPPYPACPPQQPQLQQPQQQPPPYPSYPAASPAPAQAVPPVGLPPSSSQPAPAVYGEVSDIAPQKPLPANPEQPAQPAEPAQPSSLYPDLFQDEGAGAAPVEGTAPPAE